MRLGSSQWYGHGVGIVVTAALALVLAPPAAHAAYPAPLPDFAHPGTPHFPHWSPASGARGRPVLVIYAAWSDLGFPAALTSQGLSQRFFGAAPSVADYFRAQSFGALRLTPAAETDTAGSGAVNDGVVRVTLNQTKAAFDAMTEGARNKALLQAADASVNFASFDANNNGSLDPLELTLNRIESDTRPLPAGCGATRGIDAVSLDGKQLGGLGVAQDSTATNLVTIAHENWHNLFSIRDFYGFGVGSLDISGPTCTRPDTFQLAMAAWEKLHLGWIRPTVVTRDGYYDVRAAGNANHDAFVLYDHDRGTQDFLMVENRRSADNLYDSGASDSGLVIWRLDERHYNTANDAVRPVEIMRPDGVMTPVCTPPPNFPCYAGNTTDAWDAADTATPQRALDRPWRDGTASRVAVRAVGCAGASMRPYLDVRGPGVLVDPFALERCNGLQADLPHLNPGEASALTYTVMNTGEASDSFDFTFEGLPAGWSAGTDTKTIAAGTGSTATVTVTPPAGAPAGQVFTIRAVGRSRSDGAVTSSAPLRVKVNPTVSIGDAALTEGDSDSENMVFEVSLSQATDKTVRVDYATADATARAPDDYVATTGTVTFFAGQQTRTISVAVNGDTAPEPDETFLVRLSNPTAATIADGEAVGTIRTDPEPAASIRSASIEEESAPLEFTVALTEPNNTPVTVDFATADGTAGSPADYTSTNGTVQFAIGETVKTISVPIKEDFADELDETFTVRLSNIRNAFIEPAGATATGTIVDDDRDGAFTCRAMGLSVGSSQLAISNPPDAPCRDDARVASRVVLGAVSADTLRTSTDQTPDDLTGTKPQVGDKGAAHAEASNVSIVSGLNILVIQSVTADARAECKGGPLPQLSGSSRVALLSLNGRPAVAVDGRATIPLLLATLRLNDTTTTRNGVVQRALVLDNLFLPDVLVGEARAGFTGTDVHPAGSPCTA